MQATLRPALFQREDDRFFLKNVWLGPDFDWFFTIGSVTRYYQYSDTLSSRGDADILLIELSMDPDYEHYKRERFGIQGWLIAIGGISRAIMIGGLVLTQSVTKYLY